MSTEWDPRKSGWVVGIRRVKRRLKAAASIGLALAAGTFLSLQRDAGADATPPKTGEQSRKRGKKGQKGKKGDKEKGKPDKEEHRKGMPVPDNLLE
jgi:hypothetical protein